MRSCGKMFVCLVNGCLSCYLPNIVIMITLVPLSIIQIPKNTLHRRFKILNDGIIIDASRITGALLEGQWWRWIPITKGQLCEALILLFLDWRSWAGACPTKYRIDQIRSNSNFAWNSYRCAFEDSRPIITKFDTRHDSRTVVTCNKFRYDRPTIIEIRGTRIFSKFWIRSNLSVRYLVGQAPGEQIKRRFEMPWHHRYVNMKTCHL